MMNKPINTLTKQPHWFHALWEHSGDPVFIVDAQGMVIDSNAMANALFGQAANHPIPSFFIEQPEIAKALEECLSQQGFLIVNPVTTRLQKADSTPGILQFFPLEEPKGYVIAILKTSVQDLDLLEETARLNDARLQKLSDQLTLVSNELLVKTLQLIEEKNKLSTVINGVSEGLLGVDQSGKIIHSNQTAKELLHIGDREVEEKTFDLLCPEIAEILGYETRDPTRVPKRRLDINFQEKEIQIISSPIFDKDQKTIGFVLILHDRTKEAELDRMKSDLISIVSHELRSPLTSIKGYVDLMMGGDLGDIPETMKSYLTIVSTNANRLAALIDDMLDLSRIESGKLSMSFGKVDVKYLCDYVYLTMKPQAEAKSLEFKQNVHSGLAVSGDVERLQQVVTNLVSNAIKYTPERGKVAIDAFREQGKIKITVKDSGIGISPEDRKKLFQKFFRVKNEKTRNIGGTGLGLCIAKSIVEAHEGQIQIESQEGAGSCFSIELQEYHP